MEVTQNREEQTQWPQPPQAVFSQLGGQLLSIKDTYPIVLRDLVTISKRQFIGQLKRKNASSLKELQNIVVWGLRDGGEDQDKIRAIKIIIKGSWKLYSHEVAAALFALLPAAPFEERINIVTALKSIKADDQEAIPLRNFITLLEIRRHASPVTSHFGILAVQRVKRFTTHPSDSTRLEEILASGDASDRTAVGVRLLCTPADTLFDQARATLCEEALQDRIQFHGGKTKDKWSKSEAFSSNVLTAFHEVYSSKVPASYVPLFAGLLESDRAEVKRAFLAALPILGRIVPGGTSFKDDIKGFAVRFVAGLLAESDQEFVWLGVALQRSSVNLKDASFSFQLKKIVRDGGEGRGERLCASMKRSRTYIERAMSLCGRSAGSIAPVLEKSLDEDAVMDFVLLNKKAPELVNAVFSAPEKHRFFESETLIPRLVKLVEQGGDFPLPKKSTSAESGSLHSALALRTVFQAKKILYANEKKWPTVVEEYKRTIDILEKFADAFAEDFFATLPNFKRQFIQAVGEENGIYIKQLPAWLSLLEKLAVRGVPDAEPGSGAPYNNGSFISYTARTFYEPKYQHSVTAFYLDLLDNGSGSQDKNERRVLDEAATRVPNLVESYLRTLIKDEEEEFLELELLLVASKITDDVGKVAVFNKEYRAKWLLLHLKNGSIPKFNDFLRGLLTPQEEKILRPVLEHNPALGHSLFLAQNFNVDKVIFWLEVAADGFRDYPKKRLSTPITAREIVKAFPKTILRRILSSDDPGEKDHLTALFSREMRLDTVPYVIPSDEAQQAHEETESALRGFYGLHWGFSNITYEARRTPEMLATSAVPTLGQFGYDVATDCRALNCGDHTVGIGPGIFIGGIDVSRIFADFSENKSGLVERFMPWAHKDLQFLANTNFLLSRGSITMECDRPEFSLHGEPFTATIYNQHFHSNPEDIAELTPASRISNAVISVSKPIMEYEGFDNAFPDSNEVLGKYRNSSRGDKSNHLNIGHPTLYGGGMSNAYPVGSSPYYEFERLLIGREIPDDRGHFHKSYALGRYRYKMDPELNKVLLPLREAHANVFSLSDRFLNVYNLFRFSLSLWHKGYAGGRMSHVFNGIDGGDVRLRMLSEAYKWHYGGHRKGWPEAQFPVLCSTPLFDYTAPPDRMMMVDTYNLTLQFEDKKFALAHTPSRIDCGLYTSSLEKLPFTSDIRFLDRNLLS